VVSWPGTPSVVVTIMQNPSLDRAQEMGGEFSDFNTE